MNSPQGASAFGSCTGNKATHDGAPLPKVKDLSAEYSAILTRKKQSYAEYRKLKSEMHDWQVALRIVQTIQNENTPEQPQQSRGQEPRSHTSKR